MTGRAFKFKIVRARLPPYHAQANPVEQVNRVLKTMIQTFIEDNEREWDAHIHEFRFAYNTATHSSLKVSPAFLNLGREPRPRMQLRSELEGPAEIPEP